MNNQNNQNEKWKLLVLVLKEIAESKGVTQNEIANNTGLIQSNISRFFSLRYKPNLETLIKISNALNCKITITENE